MGAGLVGGLAGVGGVSLCFPETTVTQEFTERTGWTELDEYKYQQRLKDEAMAKMKQEEGKNDILLAIPVFFAMFLGYAPSTRGKGWSQSLLDARILSQFFVFTSVTMYSLITYGPNFTNRRSQTLPAVVPDPSQPLDTPHKGKTKRE